MASIIYGGGVSAIRGSIGGITYSKNANGAYAKAKSQPANRNSDSQQDNRNTFGAVARKWKDLTDSQQKSFIDQVKSFPYIDRNGQSSFYTGFQLFVKVNSQLNLLGLPGVSNMQPPVSLPATELVQVASLSAGTASMSLNVVLSSGTTVPTDTVCVIRATREYSGGTYRPKSSDFRNLVAVAAATSLTNINILSAYSAVFGTGLTEGNTIFFEVLLVSKVTAQTTKAQGASAAVAA